VIGANGAPFLGPARLSFDVLDGIAAKITKAIPEGVSFTYNITTKPTSTIETILLL